MRNNHSYTLWVCSLPWWEDENSTEQKILDIVKRNEKNGKPTNKDELKQIITVNNGNSITGAITRLKHDKIIKIKGKIIRLRRFEQNERI